MKKKRIVHNARNCMNPKSPSDKILCGIYLIKKSADIVKRISDACQLVYDTIENTIAPFDHYLDDAWQTQEIMLANNEYKGRKYSYGYDRLQEFLIVNVATNFRTKDGGQWTDSDGVLAIRNVTIDIYTLLGIYTSDAVDVIHISINSAGKITEVCADEWDPNIDDYNCHDSDFGPVTYPQEYIDKLVLLKSNLQNLVAKKEEPTITDDTYVAKLGFSTRVTNLLIRCLHVMTYGDLRKISVDKIKSIKGMGPIYFEDFVARSKQLGLDEVMTCVEDTE